MDLFDVVIAKKLSGGGGSGTNYNHIDTYTGTVAELCDTNVFNYIRNAILANDGTALCTIILGEQTGTVPLMATENSLAGFATKISGTDSFFTLVVQWDSNGSSIYPATFCSYQGSSGSYQMQDLTAMASMCPTSIDFIWHPLP